MWEPILEPGLTLLSGLRGQSASFCQELAHDAVHSGQHRVVLWCDGDHGFDPYAFAERNLQAGRAAEEGADRVLVKRCMTAFQWDTVLTSHLQQKLAEVDARLVVASPFDRLFVHEELQDWEQEDYTRYALRHLRTLARRHKVPVVLAIDVPRWMRTHPVLAQATLDAVNHKWSFERVAGRWRARRADGLVLDPLRRQCTLWDFQPREVVVRVA